jgi:hypothetical protein
MYLRGRCASRPDRSQLRAPRSEKRWYRPREVTWRLIVGCTAGKQQCFSGAEDVGVLATLTNDDVARRCADDLDAEAAYYRHRAVQEEQALGVGYYVPAPRRGDRPGRVGAADTDRKTSARRDPLDDTCW